MQGYMVCHPLKAFYIRVSVSSGKLMGPGYKHLFLSCNSQSAEEIGCGKESLVDVSRYLLLDPGICFYRAYDRVVWHL